MYAIQGHREDGAYPSWHSAKGTVQPGWVASPLQRQRRKTDNFLRQEVRVSGENQWRLIPHRKAWIRTQNLLAVRKQSAAPSIITSSKFLF